MSEFFFCVRVLHLPGHQRREFWEINGAVSVGIHSVDHVLQLSLCRILIEDRMTVPNSLVVKVSSPSLSKEEKVCLNSAVCCDSFNTAFFVLNNLLLFLSHFLSAFCFLLSAYWPWRLLDFLRCDNSCFFSCLELLNCVLHILLVVPT